MRIRLIKACNLGRVGDVVVIDKQKAKRLIKNGTAIISKDMTAADYKVTSDEGTTSRWQHSSPTP